MVIVKSLHLVVAYVQYGQERQSNVIEFGDVVEVQPDFLETWVQLVIQINSVD